MSRPKERAAVFIILVIMAFAVLVMFLFCSPGEANEEPQTVLVKLENGYSAEGFAASHGAAFLRTIPGIDVHVLEVSGDVGAMSRDPAVQFIESGEYEAFDVIPNDPLFSQQGNLPQIHAPAGWQYATGCSSVTIAILDTGIATHEDLTVSYHKDFSGDGTDDRRGHGTHVAGIAAANTDNSLGIAGVAWEADLISVKVLGDDGIGCWSWVAEGIVYATDYGADIINMSLGGRVASQTIKLACEYAYDNGVVLVAAAGNLPWWVAYPAAYPTVIAVGSVYANDARDGWSAMGPELELMAPGVQIVSTDVNNTYTQKTGTSMAAPHVAGLVALMLSESELTPEQVRARLIAGADDLGEPGFNEEYGHGRINVYNTLKPSVLRDGIYIGGDVLHYYTWMEYAFGDPALRDKIAEETTRAGFSGFHVVDSGQVASLRDILDKGFDGALRDYVPGDLAEEYTDTNGQAVRPPLW